MNKTNKILPIVLSFIILSTATPAFAKDKRESKSYSNSKYELELAKEQKEAQKEAEKQQRENDKKQLEILREADKQVKQANKEADKQLRELTRVKTHDDEEDHSFASSTQANMKARIQAFRAAVKKAQADYKAAMLAARQAFLNALLSARQAFLNGTTTTTSTAPYVVNAAFPNPSPVTGTTTTLSVLGGDDNGEGALLYTWSTVSQPAGVTAPTFSVNGTNASKTTVVTFYGAGTYQFQAAITDANAQTVYSTTTVTVNQSLTSVSILPVSITVKTTSSTQLTASAVDQFGKFQSSAFGWLVAETGAGSVDNTGLYTAPTATGTFHVVASSNVDSTKKATSTISVVTP